MDFARLASTCTISEPFETGLKLLRDALHAGGVGIIGEFDVTGGHGRDINPILPRCRVLYLDSPLLLFEALALDRAAAIFLPLHVLVREEGAQTRAYWIDPATAFSARAPGGVAVPIYDLRMRLARALAWLN